MLRSETFGHKIGSIFTLLSNYFFQTTYIPQVVVPGAEEARKVGRFKALLYFDDGHVLAASGVCSQVLDGKGIRSPLLNLEMKGEHDG